MIAFSCSGFSPNCSSICAWGNCERKRSIPSRAMRSVMRILTVPVIPAFSICSCTSAIVSISPSLALMLKLLQASLHCIHRLRQIGLGEKAKMPHAEDFPVEMLLAAGKDDMVFFAQLFEQGFGVNMLRRAHGCDGI